MQYLVMEVHPAYAILLDESGRFVKAANLGYETGDTVTSPVLLHTPNEGHASESPSISHMFKVRYLVATAACLLIIFLCAQYYSFLFIPYGSIQLRINPQVQMDVSRSDRVVNLTAMNSDGEDLISGYSYSGKTYQTVADELADRAISMGYLAQNGEIVISVSGRDSDWNTSSQEKLSQELNQHLEAYTIVIKIGSFEEEPQQTTASPPPTAAPSTAPTRHSDSDEHGQWAEDDDDDDDDDDDNDDDDGDDDDDNDDDDGDDDDDDDDSVPTAPPMESAAAVAPSPVPSPPVSHGDVDDENDDDDDDDDDNDDDNDDNEERDDDGEDSDDDDD